ncbi:MAG: hypothetical protein CMJ65_07435 [Planctomycetaceae bacterium]|nr:hypothetical protein [Planctomycetaceae bacterium]
MGDQVCRRCFTFGKGQLGHPGNLLGSQRQPQGFGSVPALKLRGGPIELLPNTTMNDRAGRAHRR